MIAGVPAADRRIGPEVAIVPLNKIALRAERMPRAVGRVVDEELDRGPRRRVFRPVGQENSGLKEEMAHIQRPEIGRWLPGERGPIRDHAARERCIVERAITPLCRIAHWKAGGALPGERRARRIR